MRGRRPIENMAADRKADKEDLLARMGDYHE
jgi:hypothetical protein